MTTSDHAPTAPDPRRFARAGAFVFGAVFLVVGILGFVPGVTTDYDQMQFAGHQSGAELLGLFQVSGLHNVVHLALGVAGLVMARTFSSAVAYLYGAGILYAVLFFYGVAVDQQRQANFVPLNDADNWLHLGLAVALVLAGYATHRAGRGDIGAQTPM